MPEIADKGCKVAPVCVHGGGACMHACVRACTAGRSVLRVLGVLGQAAGAPLQVRLCCGLLAPEANLAVDTRVAILQGEEQQGTAMRCAAATPRCMHLPGKLLATSKAAR